MVDFVALKAPFEQSQISWRAQTVTERNGKTYALALAYIDQRDVQNRLDAVCGEENWQNKYSHAGDKTICDIAIKCGNEWIWKADGAGDTDVEAEKGAMSDAFKRAAVKWGIGRYLYQDNFKGVWVECEAKKDGAKWRFVKFIGDPWDKVKGVASVSPRLKEPDDMYCDNQIIAINAAQSKEALRDLKMLEATRWAASPKKEFIYGAYNEKFKSFAGSV